MVLGAGTHLEVEDDIKVGDVVRELQDVTKKLQSQSRGQNGIDRLEVTYFSEDVLPVV